MASTPAEAKVIIVEAPKGRWPALRLGDVWEYRELLYFLTWRDVKVRYKQTILGAAWAVIQPLFTMVVFSIFFGKLAKVPSDGVPYPIFAYAALVPWSFFASGLTSAADSLVSNARLVTKVYFPRLTIPIAAVVSGLVDFAIALSVLFVLMAIYGRAPSINALWLPVFVLMAMATATGVGLWLSAFNAKYRDVRYTLPFIVQAWLFITPVAYPSSLLDEPWRTVYGLNPMVGVVEGFRWGLLGTDTPPDTMALVSVAAAFVVLVTGAFYFRKLESTFADVV
jgi:lipopolysaccharide transport system permease protein